VKGCLAGLLLQAEADRLRAIQISLRLADVIERQMIVIVRQQDEIERLKRAANPGIPHRGED
jgi:hypothetical protein